MTPNNERRLVAIKVLVAAVFGLMIFYGGDPLHRWPFTHWTMYSEGPVPTNIVTHYYLRAWDTTGTMHIIQPGGLSTLDDDIHSQPDGRWLILGNEHHPEPWRVAERLPILETYLGHTIVRYEMWQQHYALDYSQWPPFSLDEEFRKVGFSDAHVADARAVPLSPPGGNAVLRFDDTFDLLDVFIGNTEIEACNWLYVRTWWQASVPPPVDYSASFTLADANGVGAARDEGPLNESQAKFWQPGDPRMDYRHMQVPCEPGSYDLLATIYDPATSENLTVTTPDGAPVGEYAYLTTITVVEEGTAQ